MNEMQTAFRDFLIRFQQAAVRETGHRPTLALREGIDRELLLPGCPSAGYAFWQPMPWPKPPQLGKAARSFHADILDVLTFCRYQELSFTLPVSPRQGPLSCLYRRPFLTQPNPLTRPPQQTLKAAVERYEWRSHSDLPLYFPFAAADPLGESFVLCLDADNGKCYLHCPNREDAYWALGISLGELLRRSKPCFS